MTGAAPALIGAPFWFLRHGQTDWNKDNRAQGLTDVPLNQTGLDQAAAAAALLEGAGIASLVCSPLIRARVTADIVGARLGVAVEENAMLHEAAFGSMEGHPMLAPWFTAWIDGVATPAGAEPFASVIERAVTAVNQALASCLSPVLVIAHGALFRGLRTAMGLPAHERLMNATPLRCEPAGRGEAWTLSAPPRTPFSR